MFWGAEINIILGREDVNLVRGIIWIHGFESLEIGGQYAARWFEYLRMKTGNTQLVEDVSKWHTKSHSMRHFWVCNIMHHVGNHSFNSLYSLHEFAPALTSSSPSSSSKFRQNPWYAVTLSCHLHIARRHIVSYTTSNLKE